MPILEIVRRGSVVKWVGARLLLPGYIRFQALLLSKCMSWGKNSLNDLCLSFHIYKMCLTIVLT